jgi:hypothetical protein
MRIAAVLLGIALVLSGCSPAPSSTAAASALASDIQRKLAENFGGPGDASWYADIKGVSVEGSTLVVLTDLTSRSDAAAGVCRGASNYVFANDADPSLKALEVRGPEGLVLIRRAAVGDHC